jgi:hypothetical protein
LLLLCTVCLGLTGCEALLPRADAARVFATQSAAYAGRFRLAYGRWPASVNELEAFMCMSGHADRFGLEQPTCDEIVNQPYRTVLMPTGADLRMRYVDSSGESVCTLRIHAPAADADTTVFPMITIRTTVFSCPGDGQDWRIVNIY